MLRRSRKFARSRSGMAAVEFAFIAPVMILLFFGGIELADALNCKSRVTRVASTVADLVAQSTVLTSADVTNIFNAANAILYPYPAGQAKIVITSLKDVQGNVKVDWSKAQNTSVRSTVPNPMPAGLIVPNSGGSVIFAEISYTYSSITTHVLPTTITMTGSFYSRPRRALTVTCNC